jgi:hypothetical protein
VFWARAFTPLIFLCPSPKTKKFENFLKQFRLLSEKRKGIHQLTRHIWLRLLYKGLHLYLPPLRYGKHQICRYVIRYDFLRLEERLKGF